MNLTMMQRVVLSRSRVRKAFFDHLHLAGVACVSLQEARRLFSMIEFDSGSGLHRENTDLLVTLFTPVV